MLQKIEKFLKNECGAVTVDWVVLCAAVLALGVAVFMSVDAGTNGLASSTQTYLSTYFD